MKGGLCIYTSLLTISVLSSFALFVLVVSEVGQASGDGSVDLSGLHNVSQKSASRHKGVATVGPRQDVDPVDSSEMLDAELKVQEMIFADTLSLNSVTTDGLPEAGHPQILISLADNAKLDLKPPEELLFANDSEQHNDTKTFIIMAGGDAIEDKKDSAEIKEPVEKEAESHLVVQAKSMHEVRLTEDAFLSTTTPLPEAQLTTEPQTEETTQTTENIPVKAKTPQEDIPSFSEWAQKQLAEAEKKDTVLNHSSQPSHSNSNFSNKNTKLRSKNYASLVCGAKVVAVNPEAGSPSAILSPNRDEYMLNTCNSRIWFIVELCEAVQAQKIEIANFELFSSTPKDIAVYFSDRFPTRDWTSVGQFTAQDLRDVQSFDLFPHLFGKFIKVEMLSHHGSEHYCPISLFKVYGTSEFEVLEKESSQHAQHLEDDEEDEIIDVPDITSKQNEASKNLFGSARDAVMSIMKKAAQALVKTEVPKNVSSEQNDTSVDKMYKKCCSPSHIIVCDNCSETLYNEVYELISCSSDRLTNLLRQVFLRDTLKCTEICRPFGLDFKSTKTIEFSDERVAYLNALFSQKYISALCNMLAIKEKKVVLNTSFETETSNVLENITLEESIQNISTVTSAEPDLFVPESNLSSTETEKDTVETEIQLDEPKKANDSAISEDANTTSNIEKEKVDENKSDLSSAEDKPTPEVAQSRPDEFLKSTLEVEKNVETKPEGEVKDATKSDAKSTKAENGVKDALVEELTGEQLAMESDSLLSDLEQMAVDPAPPGTLPQTQNQAQTVLKESVFLRLSNRVKTLERNMSLSGQYLEELSRRYKKQVEEMQRTFENTVTQMTDERRKSNEREHRYLEQMAGMQDQISQMTLALNLLMEERDSWLGTMTVARFLALQALVAAAAWAAARRRPPPPPAAPRRRKRPDRPRRKSVEGVSGHATPAAKKRRPSEEALQIACHSEQHERLERREQPAPAPLDEPAWTVARRRRRKPAAPPREASPPAAAPPPPAAAPPPAARNGLLHNLKSMKGRRLSSPAFLRSFSRAPAAGAPLRDKASSESPTGSMWSDSTELSHGAPDQSRKRRSLKNIFKKVF